MKPTWSSRRLEPAAALAGYVENRLWLAGCDAIVISAAFILALLVRWNGNVAAGTWVSFASALPLTVAVVLSCNAGCGLYAPIWRHASIYDAKRIVTAALASVAVLEAVNLVSPLSVGSWSISATGCVLAGALQGALRFQSGLFAARRFGDLPLAKRILVVGAGDAGAALIRDMLRSTGGELLPVAIVDDDLRKQGHACHGVPVAGSLDDIAAVAAARRVDQVVMAIPSASAELTRRVSDLAEGAGIPMRVIPSLSELVTNGAVTVHDIRDVRIDDLLGRQQITTDLEAVRALVEGRVVLITGAGGSIGSEIAQQVAALNPHSLFLLDHDETHLHDLCSTLARPATQLLADVRDRDQIMALFLDVRPELVFHAAAHKHVPVLENHPAEAFRTNVAGTANILAAASLVEVERLIFISTDKAVRPNNVMGASKRIAEQLVLQSSPSYSKYSVVRFGNVLGSRGSVVPTFVRQIQAGGPITITDARMTRFFMSITEAVQLVLQAAVLAQGGDIFMLEMGEPVRIIDLAKRMIRMAGHQVGEDIEIRITGARPGEKLTEELHSPDDQLAPTVHPSISRIRPNVLPARTLDHAVSRLAEHARECRDTDVRELMFRLAASIDTGDASEPAQVVPQRVIDLTGGLAWSRSNT
jgi:FlaA1/EpsC-like NDP-sugar epimerase